MKGEVDMTITEHIEASRKVELERKESLFRENQRKINAEIKQLREECAKLRKDYI